MTKQEFSIAPPMPPQYAAALAKVTHLLADPAASYDTIVLALREWHKEKSLLIGYSDGWRAPSRKSLAVRFSMGAVNDSEREGETPTGRKATAKERQKVSLTGTLAASASGSVADCRACGGPRRKMPSGGVYCPACHSRRVSERRMKSESEK